MNRSRLPQKPLIMLLIKRLNFLFFGLCLLIVFLYVIGTRQEFMDVTQLLLLRILAALGLSLSAGSLYGFILNLRAAVLYRHRTYVSGAVGGLLMGIFGFLAAAFSIFIMSVVGGNIR